jgi:hypothetical protein
MVNLYMLNGKITAFLNGNISVICVKSQGSALSFLYVFIDIIHFLRLSIFIIVYFIKSVLIYEYFHYWVFEL